MPAEAPQIAFFMALYYFSVDFLRLGRFRAVFLDRDHFRVAVVLDQIVFRPFTF